MTRRKLPVVHDRREAPAARWMRRECLDLEFENGEQRT